MQDAIPFTNISVWLIAKVFVIVALTIYLVFALVVIRQVRLMIETLEVGLEEPIKIFAYLHFVFAILVLFISLLTL